MPQKKVEKEIEMKESEEAMEKQRMMSDIIQKH